ncbi:MAG: helix-turn-helix domain-containing protein [Acidiferrobacterales bacterium]
MRDDDKCGYAPPDTLTRDLGRRVRVLRAERGWSQEVLAELAGLHRNYIGHVERGEIHVSVVQLARIAQAFGLRPGVLIDGQPSLGLSPPA